MGNNQSLMAKSIRSDLQDLIEAKIINPEIAGNIQRWYEHKKEPAPNRFVLVLGVVGSLLVGLGIVLLVAHNWDELNRLTKTIFAFIPLLLAQLIVIYVLCRKKNMIVWEESSAVFLFFAIASTIALISQIYQVSGSLPSFLFTWLLLTVPLIYIVPSSVVSLLYIGVCTWYGVELGYSGIFSSSHTETPYFYFLLLLLIVPHYYQLWKNKRRGNFFHLHHWAISISVIIMLGAFVSKQYPFSEWVFVGYLALFTIFYRLGTSISFANEKFFTNPFLLLGIIGSISLLMIWSFYWPWTEILHRSSYKNNFFDWLFSYIVLFLLTLNGALLWLLQKNRSWATISPIEFSPFVLFLLILLCRNAPEIGQFIINAWILLIGLHFVRGGSREAHLGILNFGLLIILALAVIRFFDDSIPFVWRGLFFLITGVGFFAANYWILKKRKQAPTQNNLS